MRRVLPFAIARMPDIEPCCGLDSQGNDSMAFAYISHSLKHGADGRTAYICPSRSKFARVVRLNGEWIHCIVLAGVQLD